MASFTYPLDLINFNILLGNLNINVVNITVVPPMQNWAVTEHAHADFEFHIIPGGKGYINIEGNDLVVKAGELYVTGPMVKHRQLTDNSDPMTEYCIECEINIVDSISSNFAFSKEESELLKNTLSRPYPFIFADKPGIALRFEELINEVEERKVGFFLRVQTIIINIIIDLLRTVSTEDSIRQKYSIPGKSADKYRIERLVGFVEVNYKRDISLIDVSKVLFLSPRQINRLMQKTFNLTFHDYLLNYRFSAAKRLLMDTDLPIDDIAFESGFSSHYYMYQVFKRLGSPAPAQIRRQGQLT